ncbi:MAG TPA: DUF309 domain-containing protein [Nitrososphaera sp.]|jgi:hypothetical protein
MVHLQNARGHTSKDATRLLYKARELAGNDVIIRDARVSKKYIELDTSLPDNMSIDDLVYRLSPISQLASYDHVVERHMEKDEAIKKAVELFNDEKYWSAHEALEGVWKETSGEEKSILNGIILVAAAFVHDEKDEPEICLSILQRARKKLEGTGGKYRDIDIDMIADRISKIIHSGKIERFKI